MGSRLTAVLASTFVCVVAVVSPAHAAFPGANGKIAFAASDGNDLEIYSINQDGTGETQLTSNSAHDRNPAWSPDGGKILFDSDRSGTRAIWVMNADGSGQAQVTFPTMGAQDSTPTSSPDGTKIAFGRQVPFGAGGNTNECRTLVYVANSDGTGAAAISLPAPTNCSYDPDWSPDGGLIAFVATWSTPSGNNDEDVWAAKPDGTGATQLSHHPYDSYPDCVSTEAPSWTPDGGKIIFDADCDPGAGDTRFILINRDGTGQQVVGEQRAVEAVWSPDGRRIAYHSLACTTTCLHELRVANADFTSPVTIRSGAFRPDWQPIPGPQRGDYKNAAQFCKAEEAFLGSAGFRHKYGVQRATGRMPSGNASAVTSAGWPRPLPLSSRGGPERASSHWLGRRRIPDRRSLRRRVARVCHSA